MEQHNKTAMLDILKSKIESMDKHVQIEILRIMKKNPSVKLNENKSGVFINLSFLPNETLQELEAYLNYVDMQQDTLQETETQKEKFKAFLQT